MSHTLNQLATLIINLFLPLTNLCLSGATGAGTAGFMTPYGSYAALPQQGAFNGLTSLSYQNAANAAANASMQEARLQ